MPITTSLKVDLMNIKDDWPHVVAGLPELLKYLPGQQFRIAPSILFECSGYNVFRIIKVFRCYQRFRPVLGCIDRRFLGILARCGELANARARSFPIPPNVLAVAPLSSIIKEVHLGLISAIVVKVTSIVGSLTSAGEKEDHRSSFLPYVHIPFSPNRI